MIHQIDLFQGKGSGEGQSSISQHGTGTVLPLLRRNLVPQAAQLLGGLGRRRSLVCRRVRLDQGSDRERERVMDVGIKLEDCTDLTRDG